MMRIIEGKSNMKEELKFNLIRAIWLIWYIQVIKSYIQGTENNKFT